MSNWAPVVESILGGSGATLIMVVSPLVVSRRRKLANAQRDAIAAGLKKTRDDATAQATRDSSDLRVMRETMAELRLQVIDLNTRVAHAEAKADTADRKADDAETQARRDRRRIATLEDVLRSHHIEVPPVED